MLTFEEFFKKKKIHLPLLQSAEPELFAEFEQHYNQMGEKSFDHTKKYWFNQLRRKYHTPVEEVKVEKVVIENQLAEQTITEALSEQPAAPAPKLGFKPKFSTVAKPATPDESKPAKEPVPEISAPKLGFKPKFSAAVKPAAPVEANTVEPENKTTEESTPDAAVPKLGFKPKYKSATAPAAPVENKTEPTEDKQEPATDTTVPKLGFKPKFKAGVTKTVESVPQASEPVVLQPGTEVKPESTQTEEPKPTADAPKLGFKPKFKAGVTKTVESTPQAIEPLVEQPSEPQAVVESKISREDAHPTATVDAPEPKLGFKPRFKAGVTKTVEKTAPQPEETPKPEEQAEADPQAKPAYKPKFQAGNFKPKTTGEEKPE